MNSELINNVMKGDILKNGFGELGVVCEISEDIYIELLEGADKGHRSDPKYLIMPVRLTVNFLKTNGFTEVDKIIYNEYTLSIKDTAGVKIRLYKDGNEANYCEVATFTRGNTTRDIQYVHELQHIFKEFKIDFQWKV